VEVIDLDVEEQKPRGEVPAQGDPKKEGQQQANAVATRAPQGPTNTLGRQRQFKYKINLNSFDIVRSLGHGAFGRVYKVRLKQTGRFYAMKVLNKELLWKRGQIKYAKTEAHILETANHPFILSLHFAFQVFLFLLNKKDSGVYLYGDRLLPGRRSQCLVSLAQLSH
jgi:serine/threonine protein kinase